MTTAATYADLAPLMSRLTGAEKHTPSATSTLDVLWVLYDRILRIDPQAPDDPDRDRFLLSKGHGPMAYYAVLAAHGFFPAEWLSGFAGPDSRLGHHPDRQLLPGVEISSGSLGHGLGTATGLALGLRAQGNPAKTFVLVGDAELDEGSNHEAIVVAAAYELDTLTTIVVDNNSASLGWPGGIAQRFELEGWSTSTVDGRDHEALAAALSTRAPRQPRAVVAVVEPKG
ncbi:thiamine pyrophosphate-dependent enzyme [Phytoactinopolyspora limicola]|uniref:thiamine pyrophosphate-dependent enzyme n=1 Tax=Phytoactinopolyspora limicola TaxID=2715536 RepID=UPI0014094A55